MISVAHSGLCAATRAVQNGLTSKQRSVHDLRTVVAPHPRNAQALAAAAHRMAWLQPTTEAAREHFGKAANPAPSRLSPGAPQTPLGKAQLAKAPASE